MTRWGTLGTALLAAVLLTGCAGQTAGAARPPELRVSAAATLRRPFEALAPAFEREHGVRLVFDFGASGQLQKRIEAGAPADVFASADAVRVDALVAAGLVSAGTTLTFASNDLVILVPRGNRAGICGPRDLAKAERLATGDPETAAHGTKAREWLRGLGMWESLRDRFVFGENAAQTLDYVRRGEVDVALGFASEALAARGVEVAYVVPAGEVEPARYVAAPLEDAARPELAEAFVAYLRSAEAQAVLRRAGFKAAPEGEE